MVVAVVGFKWHRRGKAKNADWRNRNAFKSLPRRNAYQGIGTEYETLLRAFDKENAAFAKRVGKDRAKTTYNKYLMVRKFVLLLLA